MMTIGQLKFKWEKEKHSYAKKEVGDGVQKFVKDVLKSPKIFNLKEGLNSTKLENRKNEFKEEEKKKAARRADVVIYVSPDIVIPMEVEKYQNIKAGEKQIIQYQLDWNEHSNRRYGILTDGYIWRFYNNNEYREFVLDEIFKQTEIFLEFWREYTKPEFYYLAFFEKKGQQSLLKKSETLHVEECRQVFFEDITKLIKSFKNKLNLEGYLKSFDNKDREKRSVELTYAYIIQFILYKTLVDNEFSKFKKEFKDIQQTIFDCLKAGQYGKILGVIDGVSQMISKNIYRPFAKEQEFIAQKLLALIHQPKNELHDVSPWLDIFVFIKKYNFANVRNEIFGYIYENYLKELYEDKKKGQYFTDPTVVNFMLEQIGYAPEAIKKRLENEPRDNYVSIIDPSCGSGTFLYSAVDQIIKSVPNGSENSSKKIEELIDNNVFGLDIEEFPLYLAEMNILMRMLPLIINEKYNNPIEKKIKVFKTHDSIAEFQDTQLKYTLSDIEAAYVKSNGQTKLFKEMLGFDYPSYVRDEDDLAEMKRSLENQKIPRRRFDFVIGNPPYVSYNECSTQKLTSFEMIKSGDIKLNDIYGVNLHSIPKHRKKYSPKPNLYAFFIALGLSLLKDNGKLCYIIPQTILTAGDLDVLRYHLAKFTTIEKIITFSGKMFVGRGLRQNKPVPTSSLVFIVKRMPPELLRHQVEIIHYKDANDDVEKCLSNILENKKVIKKKILQGKLLQNVANWNFIKQDKKFLDFYEEYKKNTDDISIYYNHAIAEYYFKNKFYFDIGFILKSKNILNKDEGDNYSVLNFRNFQGYSKFTPTEYYPKNKKLIKLTQNSQGLEVLEQKYKIVWSIKNPQKFYFTDIPIIFNMGVASVVCSNNKKEIFYLFSLLNFPATNLLLEINLKNENEKEYLVPIKAIKEFIRVPKIPERNQFIKNEIIKRIEEMLGLEEIKLSDLIDFSIVIMQRFNEVSVRDGCLILEKDEKQTKLKIKDKRKAVEDAIKNKYQSNGLKFDEGEKIILSELKNLPIIDFDRQRQLKDYIDDLVFALYFNVPVKNVGLDRATEIKAPCEKNEFYKIIFNNNEKRS